MRLSPLPPGLNTLADHEAHARGVLDAAAWAYFNGGSADEVTLAENLQAWRALRLLPRALRPLAGLTPATTLLGRALAHPVLVAPLALQRLAHPDGELATAQAAAAQGAGLVVSTQASLRLEDVAAAVRGDADRGPLWFQLYVQADRGLTLDLVRRAEAAGYEALVVTVDAPVQAPRDAQWRAGFKVPPGLAVNLPATPAATDLADLLRQAPTWDDIAWLRAQTRLPVVLKGLVHPDDAREALRHGVDALIVSNHGGRALDTVPATARLLPALAEAAGGALPLLVDGGIRRGTDVLKALALGARAVLVGRPVAWGLANAGALGVAHVLRLLRDEFEVAMALCGCERTDQITPDLLC
ncbi:alpha-hydroxy acid oxidase [Ramlibacter sp. MAHUQ-53]|uniref:alpha-hydroxy acid oxidase n=1 Tax=unclassified Ramlibacter TaxID=2617605 RepID=UPI003644CAFA